MKKIFALILAMFMCITLVACSTSSNDSDGDTQDNPPPANNENSDTDNQPNEQFVLKMSTTQAEEQMLWKDSITLQIW